MDIVTYLARKRRWRLSREVLGLFGVELPAEVRIGSDFEIMHRGFGTVIHPKTTIGDRVRIYHQVTIGRADAHVPANLSKMEEIIIEDDVVLFPGSKVLGGSGVTRIGRGTIIAANAVINHSTGPGEIWGGVPARLLKVRPEFLM